MAQTPDGAPEWRPVTEPEQARAAEAIAQLKADLARVAEQPSPPEADSGRFMGPIGFGADGKLQPPLTPEEIARLAAARRGETPDAAAEPADQDPPPG